MPIVRKPTFNEPEIEGKSYVCVLGGQYHAYLDLVAARSLLYSFYRHYEQRLIEEFDIYSSYWPGVPQRGVGIGYCEFNVTIDHKQKKHGKNILMEEEHNVRRKPYGQYYPEIGRLDYFVSPEEVKTAYETLTLLVQNLDTRRSLREATLFGNLIVHLVGP